MIENGNLPATMLVSPTGNYGGGFGGFGGDWGFLLLLLLCANGGWGMGGFGGWGGMMGMGMMDGFGLYPWLNNSQNINDGFRDQQLSTQVGNIQNSITSGFGDVQTALCSGFAGVNSSINNGFAQAEIANNSRQMANMQQAFNSQIATMQGFNGVQSQNADIRATILQENCQDRYEAANNARDIIANATANTQALLNSNQRIMDKLCDQELQAERRENQNLRSELMYARGQASQIDQTAQIKAGQNATMTALVNELRSCPIPAQPVYGSQPIFTCPNNGNSGCGCQNFYN